MALKGDSGRGGMRTIGRGIGGLDPDVEGPTSQVADYFRRATGSAAAYAGPGSAAKTPDDEALAKAIAKYIPTDVTVTPKEYWHIATLPPLGTSYVTRGWKQAYSSSGVQQIIRVPETTPQGRYTLITGFRFWATTMAYGGVTVAGRPVLLDDVAFESAVEMNFVLAGISSMHWTSGDGTTALRRMGRGRLNEGYDNSPTIVFVPPGTALRAEYQETGALRWEPLGIGFDFQGYEVDSKVLASHISGTKF